MDPITYPSVVLDGTTLHFKLTLASLRRLREMGINLDADPETRTAEENTQFLVAAVSACSYTMEPAGGKLKHAGLTVYDVENLLDLATLPEIQRVVTEAMEKALPATMSPVQPAVS